MDMCVVAAELHVLLSFNLFQPLNVLLSLIHSFSALLPRSVLQWESLSKLRKFITQIISLS